MPEPEPTITINGRQITSAQAMAVRVAVNSMLMDLGDAEHMEALGEIGPLYQARLFEVLALLSPEDEPSATRPLDGDVLRVARRWLAARQAKADWSARPIGVPSDSHIERALQVHVVSAEAELARAVAAAGGW